MHWFPDICPQRDFCAACLVASSWKKHHLLKRQPCGIYLPWHQGETVPFSDIWGLDFAYITPDPNSYSTFTVNRLSSESTIDLNKNDTLPLSTAMKLSILTTLGLISIASAAGICHRVATNRCRTGCANDCKTKDLPACGSGQYAQDGEDRKYAGKFLGPKALS